MRRRGERHREGVGGSGGAPNPNAAADMLADLLWLPQQTCGLRAVSCLPGFGGVEPKQAGMIVPGRQRAEKLGSSRCLTFWLLGEVT